LRLHEKLLSLLDADLAALIFWVYCSTVAFSESLSTPSNFQAPPATFRASSKCSAISGWFSRSSPVAWPTPVYMLRPVNCSNPRPR